MEACTPDPVRREEFERINQLDREEEGWPPQPLPESAGGSAREPRPFPGLGPAVQDRLSAADLTAALALPPARVCLVPAARPADVLALTGWLTTDQFGIPPFGVAVGSVLRSWEDRFGARLLKLGPSSDIRLLVERPPRTPEAAELVASEHWAFADEFHKQGRIRFDQLSDAMVGLPVWQFWWD